MDKYEYKVRAEEIKSLIAEGAYAEAAEIADTIDWRRVKSVMMLCTVSDLYKVNRRYEDAKNMLLLAYEKRPGGRTICYSLCELCIKTEEFVQAVSYYNEFMRVAPKDPERYILQYKLYEAQNVNLEERIGVLEELKKRDYREKWAYELAYLYHRVGLATRCVEECDELILWFGEGKYVIKAMELKMLHQPLSDSQQEAYDHRFDVYAEEEAQQYAEEAESQEYGGQEAGVEQEQPPYETYEDEDRETAWEGQDGESLPEEMDIQVKTMDVGRYNTINLQEELAAGLQEVLGAEGVGNYGQNVSGESAEYLPEDDEMEGTEVFFGETGEIDEAELEAAAEVHAETAGGETAGENVFGNAGQADRIQTAGFGVVGEQGAVYTKARERKSEYAEKREQRVSYTEAENAGEQAVYTEAGQGGLASPEAENAIGQPSVEKAGSAGMPETVKEDTSAVVMSQMRKETMGEQAQPPKELADVLLQETDGQISMVLPERTALERQITGQMKIDDILAEWERMKKENEEKCREEVRQHVLRQTGPMFTEFEAAVRDGLLEQLEGVSRERSSVQANGAAGAAAVAAGVKAAKELMQTESSSGNQGTVRYAGAPGYGDGSGHRETGGYAAEPGCAEVTAGQYSPDYGEEPKYAEEGGAPKQAGPEYGEAPERNNGRNGLDNIEENGNVGESREGSGYEDTAEWGDGQEESGYAYGETPEWADGQEEPGLEYGEVSEWGDGQEEPGSAYGEASEWRAGQEEPDYAYGEAPEWGDGEEEPGYVYREAPEWGDGEEEPGYVYREAPEWGDGEEEPGYVYGEASEWGDGEEESGSAYGEAPEWGDGQEEPGLEYGEASEWAEGEREPGYREEAGEIPEEAEWPWDGADYMEAPEYAEEAESRRGADRTTGYEEAAEYREVGEEPESRNGLTYGEAPGSEKEALVHGMDSGVRNMPEYIEELEHPEDDGMEEPGEKSEALDYLEALEHVEEILEEQDDDDESGVALDPDGFEMIGPEEEVLEESASGEEEKKGSSKEDGSKQKDKRSVLEREKAKVRSLTREEKELFAQFIQNRQSREQLVKAIDSISMAAYTGNVVITGEEGMDTLTLAKNMIREVRMTDSNFSGRVAKITGMGLNSKNVREILEGLNNGALIIQKASGMDSKTAGMLHVSLQQEKFGIIVIMEDTRKAIQKLFLGTPQLFGDFTSRVDLEALSNDTLVSFGRRYAREKEYAIDDLGMLALHTRIEESQTIDHVVTVLEVKQIVDEAIRHANRKTLGHFFDILLARRYDDEDMIILTEKDFVA